MIRSYYQHSCSSIHFHNLKRGIQLHTHMVRVYLLTWADYNISMSRVQFQVTSKGFYPPPLTLSVCVVDVSTRVITYVSFRFRLGRCHSIRLRTETLWNWGAPIPSFALRSVWSIVWKIYIIFKVSPNWRYFGLKPSVLVASMKRKTRPW